MRFSKISSLFALSLAVAGSVALTRDAHAYLLVTLLNGSTVKLYDGTCSADGHFYIRTDGVWVSVQSCTTYAGSPGAQVDLEGQFYTAAEIQLTFSQLTDAIWCQAPAQPWLYFYCGDLKFAHDVASRLPRPSTRPAPATER